MDSFPWGQAIRMRASVTNPTTGDPETPAASSFQVRRPAPSGELVIITAQAAAVGELYADYLPQEPGVHQFAYIDPAGPGADPASAQDGAWFTRSPV